jgi:hypothetical protein
MSSSGMSRSLPTLPSQSGTLLSPLTPTSCTTPTTAGCMTTLTIETSASNSNSSPWVDYSADTAYVGTDNGLLYKITPVFGGGHPALVNDPTNLAGHGLDQQVQHRIDRSGGR